MSETPPVHDRHPVDQSRSLARLVLLAWWLLIFTATHIPIPPAAGPSQVPDKWIHFGMYAVLGALLPLWDGWRAPSAWCRLGMWLGVIVVYAAADELLQIPVGRTAEWYDFWADLLGGVSGLAAVTLAHAAWRRAFAPPGLESSLASS